MKVCQLGLLAAALVAGALLSASPALAAGDAPSQATLAAMGLGELHVLNDSEGLAIRGFGYRGASAAGKSWAAISGYGASAGSQNSYNANGQKAASGHTVSYAELEVKNGGDYGHNGNDYGKNSQGGHGGGKPQSVSIAVIAGGSSGGYTKH